MKERLKYLFWQYIKGAASKQELEEFLSCAREARNDQSLRTLIRDVYKEIREGDPRLGSYIDDDGNLVLNDSEEEDALSSANESPYSGDESPYSGSGVRTARKRRLLAGMAMGFVLIVLVGGITRWYPGGRGGKRPINKGAATLQSLTKKFTERTEQKFILLPDSTQVWLNANSSLEFPDEFSGERRDVILTGEAYFDVRHAEELPFIIHTGKITTTVLGTAFNIKAYSYQKEVQVSVSKGKVRVSRDDRTIAILQKGQQLKVSNVDSAFRQKSVDIAQITFWQQGAVSYDDETIGDIIQDLEHIYNVSIRIADQSLLNVRMTTSFNRNIGVDQALRLICRAIDKQVVEKEGKYLLE